MSIWNRFFSRSSYRADSCLGPSSPGHPHCGVVAAPVESRPRAPQVRGSNLPSQLHFSEPVELLELNLNPSFQRGTFVDERTVWWLTLPHWTGGDDDSALGSH